MIQWLRDFSAKRMVRVKEREARHKLKMGKMLSGISTAKKEMFLKPCPFNGNNHCSDVCVHFENGYINPTYDSRLCRTYYDIVWPKCRLWGMV